MADKFSEFGIDIGLSASGFDSVLAKFKRLSTEGEKIGKTTNEITEAMKRLKAAMEHALNVDSAKKRLEQLNTTDPNRRIELAQEIANNVERLNTVQNAWERAKKGFGDGGSVFGSLEKAIKTLTGGWVQLNTAMRPVKMMYRWVDGVAKLNMQLRMLHYSSGMAIASLKSYGAVASRYGGSENTVASYAERHQMQLTRARQGLGLGHFQDVAWKYGFGFNASESPEKRFHRAIEEMRSGRISKDNWQSFAHEEAPMRAKELLSYASRKDGLKVYEYLQSYAKSLQELTDKNGKIIATELSERSEELADSQFLLNEQWKSIKDQFALSLIPTVKKFTDRIVGVMEWFNALDPVKKNVLMRGMQLVMSLVALIGAMGALRFVFTKLAQLFKYATFMKGAGAAGGAGGGFGGGFGGGTAGIGRMGGAAGLAWGVYQVTNDVTKAFQLKFLGDKIERVGQFVEAFYRSWQAYSYAKGGYVLKIKTPGDNTFTSQSQLDALTNAGKKQRATERSEEAALKKIRAVVASSRSMGESGEMAQLARVTNNNISGDVKNDNRTFNIEQHFVSSGDVRKDAEDARDAMQERNMLDLSIN